MALAQPRRRLPSYERKALILNVAYDEFAKLGYDGVSMDHLATRAGVTKPILYRHFGSKDSLCAACAQRMAGEMVDFVRSAASASPTADGQLWAGIVAQLRFIDERRDEWRVYVRQAPLRGGVSAAALAEGRDAVTSMLADLIENAINTAGAPQPPRVEIEVQAHALQGAVEQVANWWEANRDQPLELVALRIMNFAWQGFSNQLKGRFWFPAAPGG